MLIQRKTRIIYSNITYMYLIKCIRLIICLKLQQIHLNKIWRIEIEIKMTLKLKLNLIDRVSRMVMSWLILLLIYIALFIFWQQFLPVLAETSQFKKILHFYSQINKMASHPLQQETVHSVESEARHIGYSFSDLIGTKTGNERPRKNFRGSRVRFFKSSEFSGLTNGF